MANSSHLCHKGVKYKILELKILLKQNVIWPKKRSRKQTGLCLAFDYIFFSFLFLQGYKFNLCHSGVSKVHFKQMFTGQVTSHAFRLDRIGNEDRSIEPTTKFKNLLKIVRNLPKIMQCK